MRVLILGLILCALGVVVYDAFVIARALARGNAVVAASSPFSARPPNAASTLLVVGDSTAAGTGARDPSGSIAGRIGTDFPNTRIDNLGVNGARTGAVLGQLQNAPRQHYDAVLIQVGGNDALRFTGTEALRDDIDAALAEASAMSSHIALMSTGNLGDAPAIPWPVDGLLSWRARLVRDLFSAAAARHGAYYVNLFVDPGDVNPFARSPEEFYARDGLHPSGAGYGAWYGRLRAQAPLADWLTPGGESPSSVASGE